MRVVLQTGMNRDGSIADVPTIYELMNQYQTPQMSQRLATVILAAGDIGRPIVAPAGWRRSVSRLCATFARAVADAEFKPDTQLARL